MPDTNPLCPNCKSAHSYQDGSLWVCPECFQEWTLNEVENQMNDTPKFVDANGVTLVSGDTVTLIRDLKLGKDTLKSGTKVKNIRLLDEPVNDHDISCKIPGFGSVYLKCSVVKKS